MSSDIPISELQPFEAVDPSRTIRAEISLVWPYSSSHKSAALLLVDPDFRQRHARGQVRAVFQGPAAEALAKAHLGIGDVVRVSLGGAKWRDRDERAASLTPGKAVEAELLFDTVLRINVLEDATGAVEDRVIEVRAPAPLSPREPTNVVPETPRARLSAVRVGLGTPFGGGYASPAFMKRLRLSQEHFLDSPGLAGSPTSPGNSAKRRRIVYKNVTEWHFTKGSPARNNRSPGTVLEDDEDEDEDEDEDDVMMVQSTQDISESTSFANIAPDLNISTSEPLPTSVPVDVQLRATNAGPSAKNRVDIVSDEERDVEENGGASIDLASQSRGSTNLVFSGQNIVVDLDTKTPPMPPPPLPSLKMPDRLPIAPDTGSSDLETPRLRPISAADLPLPSPFPQTPLERITTTNNTDRAHLPEEHLRSQVQSPPEVPGYFDNIQSGGTFRNIGLEKTQRSGPNIPLADVVNDAHILKGHIEGHASPSEGSEADVSSEEDESPAVTSPSIQPEVKPLLCASRPWENALVADTDASNGLDVSDQPKNVHGDEEFSPDVEVDELSSVSEPSDDEDDTAEPQLHALNTIHPDDVFLGESPVLEQQISWPKHHAQVRSERKSGLKETSDFGMDGTALSRFTRQETSVRSEPDLSQDEDAAFAVLDEALHTEVGHRIEESQPPIAPLSSTIAPGIVHPIESHAQPEPAANMPTIPIQLIPDGNETGELPGTLVQDPDREPITNKGFHSASLTQEFPRVSLREMEQQAIEQPAEQDRGKITAQPTHDPERPIEVLDLARSGPENASKDSSDLLHVPPRPSPPTDSIIETSIFEEGKVVEKQTGKDSERVLEPSRDVPEVDKRSDEAALVSREVPTQEDDNEQGRPGGSGDGAPTESQADLTREDATGPASERVVDQNDELSSQKPASTLAKAGTTTPKKTNGTTTTARRRSSRLSLNPTALATWFTPKTSTLSSPARRKTSSVPADPLPDSDTGPPPESAPAHPPRTRAAQGGRRKGPISPPHLKRYAQSQGLSTSLSYFTPLTNLDLHLSTPAHKIDVLAVAARGSEEIKRAKTGPRDWFTVFRVVDPGLWEQEARILTVDGEGQDDEGQDDEGRDIEGRDRAGAETEDPVGGGGPTDNRSEDTTIPEKSPRRGDRAVDTATVTEDMIHRRNNKDVVRVEVYRPWKASLPSVEVGDVVLLRAFQVRSRDRRTFLISGEESAWCVFRFGSGSRDESDQTARTRVKERVAAPKEEVRGPPLDIGSEERERAGELREWWEGIEGLRSRSG